jgi:hypothetical protein
VFIFVYYFCIAETRFVEIFSQNIILTLFSLGSFYQEQKLISGGDGNSEIFGALQK